MSLFSFRSEDEETKYIFKITKIDTGEFIVEEKTSNCFKIWKIVKENRLTGKHLFFEHQADAVLWIEHEVASRERTVIIKTEYADKELR